MEVTEAGLEYYVEVENSGVFATDPAGAPAESFSGGGVPTTVATATIPNCRGRLSAGPAGHGHQRTPCPRAASSWPGRCFTGQGEKTSYQTAGSGGRFLRCLLPFRLEHSGARGLEYYVQVQTLTGTPDRSAGQSCHCAPHHHHQRPGSGRRAGHSGNTYHMVSMPLDFGEGVYRDWEDLLSGQPVFGTYDPLRWRCYKYDPVRVKYIEMDPDLDAAAVRAGAWQGFLADLP